MKSEEGVMEANEGLTRRGFVQGLAVGSVGAATLGILGCSQDQASGDKNATSNSETSDAISWDREADVIVLGFGYAGIGAAVAASEGGAQVLILEKMDQNNAGGASVCNGGLLNPKSAEQLQFYTFNEWDQARCKDIAERSIAASNWMAEMDPNLESSVYGGMEIKKASGLGIQIYDEVAKKVPDLENISIEYEMRGTRLVTDARSGEVLGVVAEREGSELFIKGRKATVIATGGYDGNPELLSSLHHSLLPYASLGGPSRTGDGLKMATAVGAKIGKLSHGIEWACSSLRKASEEIGTGIQLAAYAVNGSIYVNEHGQRFDDETRFLSHNKSTLPFFFFSGDGSGVVSNSIRYKNLPMWAVWDSVGIAEGPIVEVGPRNWANTHGFDWGSDNLKHLDKGWLVQADSLEDLASKMTGKTIWNDDVSVDGAALKASVEKYNGYVEVGVDPEFNRPSDSMKALSTPPYYAAELLPTIVYTINGLVINAHSQVLDWQDEPIPRLYAAGDIGQGVLLWPIGVCGCWGEGQIAGEQAVALEPWG